LFLFRIFPQNFTRGSAATNNTPNEKKKTSRRSQGSRKVTVCIAKRENMENFTIRIFSSSLNFQIQAKNEESFDFQEIISPFKRISTIGHV
jgi:hypothetical protein